MYKAGLVELNAVVAVAGHRNFRAAAAELGMSASALSHAVAALETRMGVRLFNRTTRSVSVSEAGEEFLMRVGPALREISDAMEAANERRDRPTGTLRINTSEGAARQVLNPLLLDYLGRCPDMHVDLVTEGRLVDIVAGGFDAGIRLTESVPLDMVALPMTGHQRQAVVGSAAYFKTRKRPRTPAELVQHQCIRSRLPSGKIYRWEFEKRGEEIVMDVDGPLTLDSHHLMIDAVLGGMGLAYLNDWFVRDAITDGRLIRVLLDWTPPYPGLSLYYPSRRHCSAGLREFIKLLQERKPNTSDEMADACTWQLCHLLRAIGCTSHSTMEL